MLEAGMDCTSIRRTDTSEKEHGKVEINREGRTVTRRAMRAQEVGYLRVWGTWK